MNEADIDARVAVEGLVAFRDIYELLKHHNSGKLSYLSIRIRQQLKPVMPREPLYLQQFGRAIRKPPYFIPSSN